MLRCEKLPLDTEAGPQYLSLLNSTCGTRSKDLETVTQIGSHMFLHELVCERDLCRLVLQMMDHGMEYGAEVL